MWDKIKYFHPNEFDSPDIKDSGKSMALPLILLLDQIRERVGQPLIITSGYRSAEHNMKIGGKMNSAHLRGLAVDIQARDSSIRFKLVQNAILLNFKRIEVAPAHVHLDIDQTLPQNVLIHLASY